MDGHEGWTLVDVPDIDGLPRAVMLRSQCLPARHVFPIHTHRWNQFVYATAGTLVVTVPDAWYVITPEQAIWVPTGVAHTTGALHGAEFRNLYIADSLELAMPQSCTVFAVNALLRALIVELSAVAARTEEESYIDRVDALILDQLHRLRPQDLHLPWPSSAALGKICAELYANPADGRDLKAWGAQLGASPRTLSRHFERELGMSLRDWRLRLRLFRALEWLGAGRSVTDVALELGYASTSAFAFMFRQEMGCSPSEFGRR